jgi:chitinase
LKTSDLNGNCLPVASIGAAVSTVEGNSGSHVLVLPVTLDRASSKTVKVSWRTFSGTAGFGDYGGAYGVLTFAPGETTKNISINILGDTVAENNEVFNVTLVTPVNSILGNASEAVTIINDDKPTMSIANVSVVEGSQPIFRVVLAHPYNQPVVVNVTSANGTAKSNGDYTALLAGRKVTIPAGSTSGALVMATHTDGLTEGAETFTVTFSSTSVTNSPQTATATIQANNT